MKYLTIYYLHSGYVVSSEPILDPWEALDTVDNLDSESFGWAIAEQQAEKGF